MEGSSPNTDKWRDSRIKKKTLKRLATQQMAKIKSRRDRLIEGSFKNSSEIVYDLNEEQGAVNPKPVLFDAQWKSNRTVENGNDYIRTSKIYMKKMETLKRE